MLTNRIFSYLFVFLTLYNLSTSKIVGKTKPHPETYKIRAFSVAKLLHGIANTCNQFGNAAVAQTPEEKKQATFGIVGSLLNLAGDLVDEEESKKRGPENKEEEIKTRTPEVSLQLHYRSIEKVTTPVINELANHKDPYVRQANIKEQLQKEETAKPLLDETLRVLETLSDQTDQESKELIDIVHQKLYRLFLPENEE